MTTMVTSSPPSSPSRWRGRRKRRDRVEKAPESLSKKYSSMVNLTSYATSPPRPLKSCLSTNNLSNMGASSSGSSGSLNKRRVSFHKIEIREYERALGDNPSVRSGPPIALGWEYDPSHIVLDVEDYENSRESRRTRSAMVMSQDDREAMLRRDWGVSSREMLKATRDANITRRKRIATITSPRMAHKRQELLETAGRRIKRLVSSSSKAKDNEKLWRDAHEYLTKKNENMQKSMSLNDLQNSDVVVVSEDEEHTDGGVVATSRSVSHSCNDLQLLSLDDQVKEDGRDLKESANPFDKYIEELQTENDGDDEWGFGLDEEEEDEQPTEAPTLQN